MFINPPVTPQSIELDYNMAKAVKYWPGIDISKEDDGVWVVPAKQFDTSTQNTPWNESNTAFTGKTVIGTMFSPTHNWNDFGYIVERENLDVRVYKQDDQHFCDIVVHYHDVANQKRQLTITTTGDYPLEAACKAYLDSKVARLQGTKEHQGDALYKGNK